MKRILISNIMMIKEKNRFDDEVRQMGYEPVWAAPGQFLDERECLDLVGRIDGWLSGDDRITRRVLEKALPRLKVVSKWGTGIDSIDLAAAKDLGVPVFNSPGAFSVAVAEVALFFMLALSRRLVEVDRGVRKGDWPKPQGVELKGSRIGVIGFGAIGRRIGELASAFGVEVYFFDPMIKDAVDIGGKTGLPVSLETLAACSDFVVLACNYTPENRHMIGKAFMDKMKPGAFLVNVARGPLVDEWALVRALETGQIAGAGLDVFEEEPLSADSPLKRMDTVVLGSHNANNAKGAVERVHRNTLDNLKAILG